MFADLLGAAITAAKDHGETSLVKLLLESGGPWIRSVDALLQAQFCADALILVPMPVSNAAWRARGFNLAELLAERFVAELSLPAVSAAVLGYTRQPADQRRLGWAARRENLQGAMRCDSVRFAKALSLAQTAAAGGKVALLLVDDVVTTGATLAEARRAVAEVWGGPIGFLVLAETFHKTNTQSLERV